ncbi:MAG: hypothetical protein ACRD2C_19460 [Acidimicrobiales bacterium]
MRAQLQRGMRVCPVVSALALGSFTAPPAALADVSSVVAVGRTAAQVDDGDGLLTETHVLYEVDPDAGATHVTVQMTLENQVPDADRGTYVEQTYFSNFSVPVLREATGFSAVDVAGNPLPVTEALINGDLWVEYANIDLQPDMYYGDESTVSVTYELPNQPARAEGLSRANDAFVSFPVFANGDPGLTSVEVRIPDRYEVEVVAGDLTREERDGQIVLSAAAIPDPMTFIPVVVATDDVNLVSRNADLDGIAVEALAWPDDAQWADFVIGQLGAAIPLLTDMTGQPWPTQETLEVTETAAPYAYGYAGWYEELDHTISIGDALEPRVIVHEVSHVWFNSDLFTDRWVNEAFAEEYATTVLESLSEPQGAPPTPDRAGGAAIALNDWGNPSILDDQSEATEDYGYTASWFVLDQIAGEVGVDRMRDVIAVAADDQIAYMGDPDPEPGPQSTNWRRLLDLLEQVGGSQQAAPLFETYVVDDEQHAELAARAAARDAYSGLADRGGDWTPPLEIRELLAAWEFEHVADNVAEADEVLALRTQIADLLDGTDVERLGLEDHYETATDVADVVPLAEATLDAAEAYRDASARYDEGPGILGSVGLWLSGTGDRIDDARTNLEEGDAPASQRSSAAVQRRLDHATRDGLLRLGGLAMVGAAAAFGASHRRQRRRRLSVPVRVTAMPPPWPPPMAPPPRPPSLPPTLSPPSGPRPMRPPPEPAPIRLPPRARSSPPGPPVPPAPPPSGTP